MKFIAPIAITAMASAAMAYDACQFFEAADVFGAGDGITWQFWETNPPAWSWNADVGDATIQDNGVVYFDGNDKTKSNTIRITYKSGMTALVQPPNGMNGWCQMPTGKQNDIKNVISWD